MQEPSTRVSSIPPGPEDHRGRIVEGLAHALAEKGYADTTIADIARHSRVSKRTFYEHFRDKEECFLATYDALSNDLLSRIATAVAACGSEQRAVDAGVRAYFAALEERSAWVRPFFTDIQAAGPAALKLRREIHGRFADQMRLLVDAGLTHVPRSKPLSPGLAAALVGGINELVLLSIETGRADHVSEHCETAIELLNAVLAAPRTDESDNRP